MSYMKKEHGRTTAFLASIALAYLAALTALAACSPEQVTGDEGREPVASGTEAAPLIGTYWRLTSFHGEPVVSEFRTEPHLLLRAEGNAVAGSGGCNWIAGIWRRQGSILRLDGLSTTRMGCDESRETENAFLSALSVARSWRVRDGRLGLFDAAGRGLAEFESVGEPR